MRQTAVTNDEPLSGVSVLLVTHNAAAFITTALDSILAQTYANFRVIISDDASSDGTIEICERYVSDPRITLYAQTRRLGWVGNVNRALEYAKGKYLMIASHDDELDPEYLASLVDALEAHPNAVVAFSDMVEHTLEGECRLHVYDRCEGLTSSRDRALKIIRGCGPWWTCYRGVVRTAVCREIGGLRTHWGGEFSADMPWVLRLAIAGQLVRVPRVLYQKHRKTTSLAKSWTYTRKDWIAVLCSCLQAVVESRLPTTQALPVYRAICRRIALLVMGVARKQLLQYHSHVKSLLFKV